MDADAAAQRHSRPDAFPSVSGHPPLVGGAPVPAAELAERAARELPPEVYAYYAGGSGTGQSLSEQEDAWSAVRLRPRVLTDVSEVTTDVVLLGQSFASPILIAPTALHGLAHPDGEVGTSNTLNEGNQKNRYVLLHARCQTGCPSPHSGHAETLKIQASRRETRCRQSGRGKVRGGRQIRSRHRFPEKGRPRLPGRRLGLHLPRLSRAAAADPQVRRAADQRGARLLQHAVEAAARHEAGGAADPSRRGVRQVGEDLPHRDVPGIQGAPPTLRRTISFRSSR